MNNNLIFKLSFVVVVIFLLSCGEGKRKSNNSIEKMIENKNIEGLKKEKETIIKNIATKQEQLNVIESTLVNLDTDGYKPLITSFKIKDTLFENYIEVQGNIDTRQNILISAEYNGILKKTNYESGDFVRKGQIVAVIDDGGLNEQVAQAKIQLDLAKTNYERQSKLWEQKIGSEMQYLQLKTQYEAQEKTHEQMLKQLEKTEMKAPFSGVIDDVIVDQGTYVSVGTPIMRLVNMKKMYLKASIPEIYLSTVFKGTKAIIEIPTLNKVYEEKVRQVGNFIDPSNRTFSIEIDLSDVKNIKPNMIAKVKVTNYVSEEAVLVPIDVVLKNSQGDNYVYLLNFQTENIAITEKLKVELGKSQDGMVEVLTDFPENSFIVREGVKSVKNNQKVEIINE